MINKLFICYLTFLLYSKVSIIECITKCKGLIENNQSEYGEKNTLINVANKSVTILTEEILIRNFCGYGDGDDRDIEYNLLQDRRIHLELQKIETLLIGNNNIRNISTNLIQSFINLKYLDFSSNNVYVLENMCFANSSNLSKLKIINLKNNQINIINTKTFSNLFQLETIDLSNNKISQLNQSFAGLWNLKTLNIKNNLINYLEPGIISDLNQLKELYLDGNNLNTFDKNIFINPFVHINYSETKSLHLKLISLSNNVIEYVESLPDFVETLNLNNNLLASISNKTFQNSNSSNLKHLLLKKNQIYRIDDNSFDSLRLLETLDLSYNNIYQLNENLFLNLKNLQQFDLNNNPIYRLSNGLFDGLENIKILNFHNIKHPLEIILNEKPLNSLEYLNLNNNDLKMIPEHSFKNKGRIQYLDLSHNKIIDITNVKWPNFLYELHLSYNSIRKIGNRNFRSDTSQGVRFLYLDHNQILDIEPNAFSGLKSIKLLDLSNNNIVQLHDGLFSEMIKLKNLDLSYNSITDLPAGIFSTLENLKILNLYNNNLQKLSGNIFGGNVLTEMLFLNLNNNDLIDIQPTFFRTIPSIKHLSISSNRLVNLNKIKMPSDLEIIYLQYNAIDKLDKQILLGTNRNLVKKLYLDHNQISVIDSRALSEFNNVEEVNLSSNRIRKLNDNTFSQLKYLRKLNLMGNLLTEILPNTLSEQENMEELIISENKLYYFDADIFGKNQLHKLTTLHLNRNFLDAFESNSFKNTPNIKFLNLSNNKLTSISTLKLPETIEELHLNHNFLVTLNIDWFLGSKKLNIKLLHLSHNQINEIHSEAFTGFQSLEILDLSENNIKILQYDIFFDLEKLLILKLNTNDLEDLPSEIFGKLEKLEKLHLHGNKFQMFDGNNIFGNKIVNSLNELTLNHNELNEIAENSFKNTPNIKKLILSTNSLEDATIILPNFMEEIHLDNNGISILFKDHFVQSDNEKIKNIYLQQNQINIINSAAFSGLRHLEILNLSENQITKIHSDTFAKCENLKILNLHLNLLTEISPDTVGNLKFLTEITLYGNKLYTANENMYGVNLRSMGLINQNTKLLDLSNNKINDFNKILLPAIIDLRLTDNVIKILSDIWLIGPIRGLIKNIYLNYNKINKIDDDSFSGFQSLEYLDLSYNKIMKLNLIFEKSPNLQILKLNENLLTDLPTKIFNKLKFLKELYLNENQIRIIDGNIFDGVKENLIYLNSFAINNNNLSNINKNTFAKTPNLQYLDLSYNAIETFDDQLFDSIKWLSVLNLSNNRLQILPPTFYDRLINLNNLNLSYNRFSFLLNFHIIGHRMKIISLECNPWQCLCFDNIANYLTKESIKFTNRNSLYYNGTKPICIETKTKMCNETIEFVNENNLLEIYKHL